MANLWSLSWISILVGLIVDAQGKVGSSIFSDILVTSCVFQQIFPFNNLKHPSTCILMQ